MTTPVEPSGTDNQPNILLIMSDEHAPMFSSTYGHPLVKTPAMDRLAAEGATFTAAYCNSPICVPSRMSFLTGRYASRVGVYDNASPLASDVPTWAHAAKRRGYDVALAGKQHFIGPDQLHGFDCQLAHDLHASRRHGIADWTQGVRSNGADWSEPFRAGPGDGAHTKTDDEVEQASLSWLHEERRRSKPWFLCASFIAPHFPLIAPESYWNRYSPADVDMPVIPEGHLDAQHSAIKEMRTLLGLADYPEDVTRRARAAYYALISFLDDKIARLLDTLESTGQASNTLVIYTSDHGEMAGEHGLWRKSNFYEQSVRVPLQIRWPGHISGHTRIPAAVSLVDVAATLFELMGDRPAECDGRSLLPLVQGGAAAIAADAPEGVSEWRDEAFAEYNANGVVRPMAMLRRGRYKLIYRLDAEPEMYDLVDDPGEFDDLGNSPQHRTVRDELRRRLFEIWDPIDMERNVLASQRERTMILASSGWTPSITAEESRKNAYVDRSLVNPADYRADQGRDYGLGAPDGNVANKSATSEEMSAHAASH